MRLSKATDITIGYSRQGFDGTGAGGSSQNDKHKRTVAIGITHSF